MPLRHEPDVSHADWFARSNEDWRQLCSIGPSGFAAYARIMHPTEPPHDAQELPNVEGDLSDHLLMALGGLLAEHTSTPGDCFFGLWDGFGDLYDVAHFLSLPLRPVSRPRWRRSRRRPIAAFAKAVPEGPKVRIPARDYLLFRGPLTQAGEWAAKDNPWPDHPLWPRRRRINSPNLIWPADHAWFVATEIDLPWTGVGGSVELVRDLLASTELDVVRAEASPHLPYSRDGSPYRPD